jgi:hypothetical protein
MARAESVCTDRRVSMHGPPSRYGSRRVGMARAESVCAGPVSQFPYPLYPHPKGHATDLDLFSQFALAGPSSEHGFTTPGRIPMAVVSTPASQPPRLLDQLHNRALEVGHPPDTATASAAWARPRRRSPLLRSSPDRLRLPVRHGPVIRPRRTPAGVARPPLRPGDRLDDHEVKVV